MTNYAGFREDLLKDPDVRKEYDLIKKQEEIREGMSDRERISGLFRGGRTLFYSDIASALDIDLESVVNICGELLGEGKIEIDTEYVEVRE